MYPVKYNPKYSFLIVLYPCFIFLCRSLIANWWASKAARVQCQFPYFDLIIQQSKRGGDHFLGAKKGKVKSPLKQVEVDDFSLPAGVIVKDHFFGDTTA